MIGQIVRAVAYSVLGALVLTGEARGGEDGYYGSGVTVVEQAAESGRPSELTSDVLGKPFSRQQAEVALVALKKPQDANKTTLLQLTQSDVSEVVVAACWLALAERLDSPKESREKFFEAYAARDWCKLHDVSAEWSDASDRSYDEQLYTSLCEKCLEGVQRFAMRGDRLAIMWLLEASDHSWSGCVDTLSEAMCKVTEHRMNEVAAVWVECARGRGSNTMLLLLGPEGRRSPRLCEGLRAGMRSKLNAVRDMCKMLMSPM